MVGIARCYRPDGPGIEFRWGEIFRTCLDGLRGPPNLPYSGYLGYFAGVKLPKLGVDHPPPSSAKVNERVDLYLYTLLRCLFGML